MKSAIIGLDVGSVSTKAVAVSLDSDDLFGSIYVPANGDPLKSAEYCLEELRQTFSGNIVGVGVTGSARELVSREIKAPIVKNEITCQAISAAHYHPGVKTVIEIGGQDSKIIILQNGLVQDFSMNTVCAAGTGSFLEHQAKRLNLNLSEFAAFGLRSKNPVDITGRCTVFAESEMIHAQQSGRNIDDIVYGLCLALARNFLNDTGRSRSVRAPIVFQGGVAMNNAMIRAFEEILGIKLIVPFAPEMSGANGVALLLKKELEHNNSI